jgi:Response regulators consisting of a CheY-like receiver domain and a winged-helix DNA-binding domain
MLEESLTDAGFEVVGVYRSGALALDHLRKDTVDLLIIDVILLGERSGIDVALEARAFWMGPIIFHTSASQASIREQMAAIPNATMIFKPISDADLVRAIRALLERHSPSP